MPNYFAKAEGKRITIANAQSRQIAKMYKEVIKEINERVKFLQGRDNISSVLRTQYLQELKEEISKNLEVIDKELYKTIQTNMENVSQSVVKDNQELLKSFGYSDELSSTAFMYVPKDVVNEIMSGKLYEGKWTLSKAIWKDNALQNKDLETIVAKGIAENKSSYDIAKELEKYVNPSAKKDWDWNKVYPGVRKKIDYNAQRLARTMISHAYEESFVMTTKSNPFIEAYKWLPSYSDRMCEVCQERGEKDNYGLGPGIYPKDQLPLDHPNGMCTFSTVINKDNEQIADDLSNWVLNQGDSNLNKELDNFASDLGFDLGHKEEATVLVDDSIAFADKYGKSTGTNFSYWYGKLDDEVKAAAKKAKEASGLSWQKWYEKYIYSGGHSEKSTEIAHLIEEGNYKSWIKQIKSQTKEQMRAMEDKVVKSLDKWEKGAIKYYTGQGYGPMNEYMRLAAQGKSRSEIKDILQGMYLNLDDNTFLSIESYIRSAKSALNKMSLEETLVLRRGSSFGDLAGFMGGDFETNKRILARMSVDELKEKFEGTVGVYNGFTSTSSIYSKGFVGDVEVIIKAPQGTQGGSITKMSLYGGKEAEVLLNAGTKVMIEKIEKSDGHKGSLVRIFMSVIN